MTLVEFIGSIFGMAGVLFLIFKHLYRAIQPPQNPQQFEEMESEHTKALKNYLKLMDIDIDEEEDKTFSQEEVSRPVHPPRQPSRTDALKYTTLQFKTGYESPNYAKFDFKSSLDDFKPANSVEKRFSGSKKDDPYSTPIEQQVLSKEFRSEVTQPYNVNKKSRLVLGSKVLHSLSSRREMLIINEIFGAPLSLRKDWSDVSGR